VKRAGREGDTQSRHRLAGCAAKKGCCGLRRRKRRGQKAVKKRSKKNGQGKFGHLGGVPLVAPVETCISLQHGGLEDTGRIQRIAEKSSANYNSIRTIAGGKRKGRNQSQEGKEGYKEGYSKLQSVLCERPRGVEEGRGK